MDKGNEKTDRVKKQITYTEEEVTRLLNKLFWDLRKSGDKHLTAKEKKISGLWWYRWFSENKKQ